MSHRIILLPSGRKVYSRRILYVILFMMIFIGVIHGQVTIREHIQISPKATGVPSPGVKKPFQVPKIQGFTNGSCGPEFLQDTAVGHAFIGGTIRLIPVDGFTAVLPNVSHILPALELSNVWLTDKMGNHIRKLKLLNAILGEAFFDPVTGDSVSFVQVTDSIEARLGEDYSIRVEISPSESWKPSQMNLGWYGELGNIWIHPSWTYYIMDGDTIRTNYYDKIIATQYALIDSSQIGVVPIYDAPPYSGGAISVPHQGMYRLIFGQGRISNPDSLYITMPNDSLLLTDISEHYGDTLVLGPFEKGEQLQLALVPGWGYFKGRRLFACVQPDMQYPRWGISFTDWASLDFNIVEARLEYVGDFLNVKARPRRIAPGDTSKIEVKYLSINGDTLEYPQDESFEAYIAGEDARGVILNRYNDIEKEMITNATFWYIADSEQEEDTIEVDLNVKKISGGMAGKISNVPISPSAIGPSFSMRGESPPQRRQIDFEAPPESGSTEIGVEQPRILLGETKYYEAIINPDDKTELKIVESMTPQDDGQRVNFTIMPKNKDQKLGVYYEFRDSSGTRLDSNLAIRLIGRYWKPDTSYKVKLLAISLDGARNNDSIIIEVKKPSRLGKIHRRAKDVFDREINIDDSCIYYGGMYGIPPHFLKAQISIESPTKYFTFDDGEREEGFTPGYRYEPYSTQFSNEIKELINRENPFVTLFNSLRDPPPPEHLHVRFIDYIRGSPVRVSYFVDNYSQLIDPDKPGVYGIRLSDGRMHYDTLGYTTMQTEFDKMFNYFRDPKGGSLGLSNVLSISQAADSARIYFANFLKKKWKGGLDSVTAQTRIAASYGLFQTLYPTGIVRKYPEDVEHIPEGLNIPEILFPLSVQYQVALMKLKSALGDKFVSGNKWDKGFEESFKIYIYHPKWNCRSSYPNDVIRRLTTYLPKK